MRRAIEVNSPISCISFIKLINQSVLTINLHHPTLTVSYNSNGATSGSVPGNTVFTYDTSGTLATNSGNLVKTGYNFGRMG